MAENVRELLVKYKADVSELQLAGQRLEAEVKRIEASAQGAGNAIGKAFTSQVQQVDILTKRLAALKVARDASGDPEKVKRLNTLIEAQGERIKKLSEFGGVKIIDPQQLALIDTATKRLNQLKQAQDASTDPTRTERLNRLIAEQAARLQNLSVIKPVKLVDPAQVGIIENIRQRIEKLTIARDKSNDTAKIARYNDLITQQQERLKNLATVPAPRITADLEKQIAGLKSKVNPLADSFKALGRTIIAAFAVDNVIRFGRQAVLAFAAQEKSRQQLLNALNGQVEVQQRLLEQAEELKDATATDDDTINSLQVFLATQGRTEEQIRKTTLAAIEFAAVTGDDVQTVLRNLDATFEGNIGRLGRFDKRFQEFTKTELANGAAIDLINEKYRGFAEGTLNTTAGKLRQAEIAVDDFKKRLGEILVLNVFPQYQRAAEDLLNPLKDLANAAVDIAKELGLVKTEAEATTGIFDLMGKAMRLATLPLRLVLEGFNLLAEGFKNTVATGNGFIEAVKVIFSNLKTIAVETGKSVGNIIGGIFTFDRAQIAKGIAQASVPFKEIGKQVGEAFERGRVEIFARTLDSAQKEKERIKKLMGEFGISAKQAVEVIKDEIAKGQPLTDDEIRKKFGFTAIVEGAKKVNESLEKLNADIQNLQNEQARLTDPRGADKNRFAQIQADIEATQAKIDEITGKAAKDRANKEADAILKARQENSKKLLELEQQISEDLNELRAKSAIEQLAAQRQNKEKELQATFEASEKTIQDQENLNSGLLKLKKEFGIKERELIAENDRLAAQQREDDARGQIQDIQAGLQSALDALDLQQGEQTLTIKRNFLDEGDFSPEAERKLQQDLFDIETEFNAKRLAAQTQFVTDFIAANDRLLDAIDDAATAEKQRLSEDLFSGGGLFDITALAEFGKSVVKIDKETAEKRKGIARDTAAEVNKNEKAITDEHARQADKRIDKEEAAARKREDLEREIARTIISGTEQIIQQSLDRRAEEQIKSIESVRDAQIESIEEQIEANKKLGDANAISAKEERQRNEDLLRKKEQAEARAAAQITKIKRKQFVADQVAAISKIAIETAINVTEFAEFPPVAAALAALGIAQAAIVAAQPNPYKAGAKKTKQGLAIVGEEGPELMQMPANAKVVSAPKTKKNAALIDAMFDDNVDKFIQSTYVNPQIKKEKTQKKKLPVIPNTERFASLIDTHIKDVLVKMQISGQLRQAETKYKEAKEKTFAENIANSFAITNVVNGQLTANDMDFIRRKGNYIRNGHVIAGPIVEAINNIGKNESFKR